MNKYNNKKIIKIIAIIAICILIISIIPMLITSFYSHPHGDDYDYSVFTAKAVASGKYLNLIPSALKTVKNRYFDWQGTYSAIFLMALQPSVFGDNFYFLGTWIILLIFLISNFFIMKELVCNKLNLEKDRFLIVFSIITFISIQTLPSLVEGYYWWNGASYYTIFYCLELIEMALILKYNRKNNKGIYGLICVLNIVVAGSNFVTALQQIILLFFINLYLIMKKKDKSQIPFLILSIIGLLISALAPGNAVRAAKCEGMSAINAIIESFKYANYFISQFNTSINKVIVILVILFLYKSYDKCKFKFNFPIVFTLLTYCIFSAQSTPSFYAQSTAGPNRLINIIYYSYFWFAISNVYYWIGWIRLKLKKYKILTSNSYKGVVLIAEKYGVITLVIIGLLILPTVYNQRGDFSSIKTYRILKDGSAKQYRKEYKDRVKILKSDEKNVKLKEYSTLPEPLFVEDISEDPKHWINVSLSRTYGKETIVLVKEKKDEE